MDRWIKLIERKYPNTKTQVNYISRLKSLAKHVPDVSVYDILMDPDAHYPKIQAIYPSLTTRKNLLTTFMVLFREDEELKQKTELAAKWKKLHDDLSRLQNAKIKRSEPEEKQVEKYTSFEEIEKKYIELRKRGYHDTQRHSMQYLLLSILVHLRPKRADLGSIFLYREEDPRKTDINYIVLRKKGASYLVMNVYKTSKYHQTVEEDLAERLVLDINTSLTRWPRDYLFCKNDGTPMSNNTYTAFVKATFEDFFGRATGVSLLRHIYITEKLDFDNMTLEEQDEEAKLMLHTSGLQKRYKWPKKVICPKLCAAYIEQTHKTRKIKKRKDRREEP